MGCGQKQDGRLEKLAMDVLGVLGELDTTIFPAEKRVAVALYAVMADDGPTISV
jgi:hypothetical protein